jgi:ferrochelatase
VTEDRERQSGPVGVLVMAYGTPSGPQEIAAFYTDVRRGRPPSAEQLADLERRYRAIGGVSPLAARTAAQAAGIARALEAVRPGVFRVALGLKHAPPRIEDGIRLLAHAGARRLVGVVLAPHYSRLSVGEYEERAAAAARQVDLSFAMVRHWHDHPVLVELLARRVRDARARLEEVAGETLGDEDVELVVSAHSLPARILDTDDPYPDQLAETARLVAQASGMTRWRTAWQSAGRTAEPWLGPDVLEVLRTLAADGRRAVVVCPAGFTSDHLEVCYDLDIEASAVAEASGLLFARTASLNDDPALCAALAELAALAAGEPLRADGRSP